MKKMLAILSIITPIATLSGCAMTPNDMNGMTGSVIGAAAGGLLGNQIGKGSGKTAMTALGAAIGAQAGRQIADPCAPQANAGSLA